MSKYIIDIPNVIEWGVVTCRTEDGFYTRDFDSLEELNSDYINEHFGELQDEAYQAGLNDAWEAARKIVTDTDHGGLASRTLCEIFDTRSYSYIMRENTAQEAVDKIKAYDDSKHSDRIEVGDWVYDDSDTPNSWAVVTWADGNDACVMCKDGSTAEKKTHELRKTGRHFDIASILEAMRK